jgi:hypothetical protein
MSTFLANVIILFLGAIIALVGRNFLEKYVGTRAQHIAEGVNFSEKLDRSFADQAAKSAAARLDVTKAEYAMKIMGLISEIDTYILNWKLTAFFCSDEIKEGETVEDLGIRDLKKVAQLTILLLKVTGEGTILLGDNVFSMVVAWVKQIHELQFIQYAVYDTSKKANKEKPVMSNDRVTTISNLSKHELEPAQEQARKLSTEIKNCLRNAVGRDLSLRLGRG